MSGYNLPPGCTTRMIEDAFGEEYPCEVCGKFPDDCICPECPTCGSCGDPNCYLKHGLIRSDAQAEGRKKMDDYRAWERAESTFWRDAE